MKTFKRVFLCVLAVILCFSFSGCGRLVKEIKATAELKNVNEYIANKYTNDTFSFVHKSEVVIRDSLFGFVDTKYNVYRCKSNNYNKDFYIIWEQDKYVDKDIGRIVYDNYGDLKYYDKIFAEINSVASQIEMGEYAIFFDLSCVERSYEYEKNDSNSPVVVEEKYHKSPYSDKREELPYDEYLGTIQIYPCIVYSTPPENIEQAKVQIKSVIDANDTLNKLQYCSISIFFGNPNNAFHNLLEHYDLREYPLCVANYNIITAINGKELDAAGLQLKKITASIGKADDDGASIYAKYFVKDTKEQHGNFSYNGYLEYEWT